MVSTWHKKYKRYSIKGRQYWYKTEDGGCSWRRVSQKEVLEYVDSVSGIVIT